LIARAPGTVALVDRRAGFDFEFVVTAPQVLDERVPAEGFRDVCCDPESDPEQAFRDGEMFAVEAVIIEFPGELAQ
jgi:hypothetical protein